MQSLLYGLIAALTWGLHDFCVRHLSQKLAVAAMLLAVLSLGSVALIAVITLTGSWAQIDARSAMFAIASGSCYVFGCVGLYIAFGIGPVRLVAPIGGAYPVLSVALAAVSGQSVRVDQWLATLAVVVGIAVVARQPDNAATDNRIKAMLWAALGATGFALTFALGHVAAQGGAELSVILVARLTAVLIVGAWVIAHRQPLAPLRPHLPLLALMGVLDVTALGFVIAAGSLANPEFAAVASSVFGLITILLAWRFLGEAMRAWQWCGIALVFAGIAWLAAS
ncbi:MAG: DMT family transporter [Rhodoferax sp.]|nr:DMT family transporter [Pseudorhodobacter sp.]